MQRDEATLLDIWRAAQLTQRFIGNMSKAAFLDDLKTQSSVLYQLLVVGEAVKRLSGEFRTQHDDIPWSLMTGMRDHLIHAYDTVDWEEVWKTVSSDVSLLLAQLAPLLPKKPIDYNAC